MQIDFVVVHWNAWEALRTSAAALLREADTGAARGRIIVVDNASRPPTAGIGDWLAASTCFLPQAANLGFAAACNVGAAHSRADIIVFMNPDAYPLPGAADAIRSCMQASAVGVVGLQMVSRAGAVTPSCFRFPTLPRLTAEALALDRVTAFHTLGCRMREWDHGSPRAVDQVIGAFMAVRRKAFERAGGFDSQFFLFYEEVDLCRRLRDDGWEVRFDPRGRFVHAAAHHETRVLGKRLAYAAHGRLVYARKHFGRAAAVAVLALAIFVEPLVRLAASLVAPRRARPSVLPYYLFGFWRAVRHGGWRRSVEIPD